MRFLVLIVFCVLTMATGLGRTMQDIFKDAPDAYFPTLTHSGRLDLIDFKNSDMKAVVKNVYGEPTELTELSDRYLRLQMSASSTLEILLLANGKDSLLCVVKTVYGPEAESDIGILNASNWKPLNAAKYLTIPSWEKFLTLPAGKSQEEQKLAISKMDLPFVSASIDTKENALRFVLSVDGGFTETREEINVFFKQDITLKWNGKKFK